MTDNLDNYHVDTVDEGGRITVRVSEGAVIRAVAVATTWDDKVTVGGSGKPQALALALRRLALRVEGPKL